jgi:hypothetical protein
MKRDLILLVLALFVAVGIATAAQQQFMFGVWSGGVSDAQLPQYTQMLSNTLHFNTLLGHCYKPEQLQAYTAAGLKAISANDWQWDSTVTYWPRIYSDAAYSIFESEGTDIGLCHLVYRGGEQVQFGSAKCQHFAAVGHRVDSLIQTGPEVPFQCGYCQTAWYYPQHQRKGADSLYHYTAGLRFKLGPRPPEAQNDTIAVFYIYRFDSPDESYPGQNDTLIEQQPVYILNSAFGDAATDFETIDLTNYHYNNTVDVGDRSTRYACFISYQVRWYGTRDIYIDQVKVSDEYGKEFWETLPNETEPRGFQNLRSQAAAYYGNSPTVLGWYQSDDASMMENRDNVLSVRRVDSLLGAWYPGKKGFVPAYGVDYLSLASYSNISFQWYPIFKTLHSSSESSDPLSLQIGWDIAIPALLSMKELALDKGVPCYPLIQGFEGENGVTGDSGWRRPTAGENLCQVNLALAYGADGLWYWKYYGADGSLEDYTDGLVDGGDIFADTTTTWSEIKNVIGPYIDKMGPIFASLNWKHAWQWGGWLPSGTPIVDIRCDQYGQSGQDPLYLQVAEFENPSLANDTAYFFLVNRRCSPEESITGTLHFNEFGGVGREAVAYYVTDMLTGMTWICDKHHPPDPPYSFGYAVPPGAGRLYRVTPHLLCQRGDANSDGSINISDAVFLIAYIFAGGDAPDPLPAGDANGDGSVNISDAVFLIAYIFAGGAPPPTGCD